MNESEVQQKIQLVGPIHSSILMRNNVGAFLNADGQMIRFGLNNTSKAQNQISKSSDLIGITSHVVKPEDVGRTLGIFTAIECKAEGWRRRKNDMRELAQENFLKFVKTHGGIAGFASSVDEFLNLIS